jgi:hypothetical protein
MAVIDPCRGPVGEVDRQRKTDRPEPTTGAGGQSTADADERMPSHMLHPVGYFEVKSRIMPARKALYNPWISLHRSSGLGLLIVTGSGRISVARSVQRTHEGAARCTNLGHTSGERPIRVSASGDGTGAGYRCQAGRGEHVELRRAYQLRGENTNARGARCERVRRLGVLI